MTVERTLAKVDADLGRGDLEMARTRLTSLVGSLPQELVARERLAEVHRLEGHQEEAGRWAYLAAERLPEEVAAFERSRGHDPVRIMRALAWAGEEDDAATEVARARLRDVRERAEAKAGKRLDWATEAGKANSSWLDTAAGLGCLAGVVTILALAVVGAVAVARWAF